MKLDGGGRASLQVWPFSLRYWAQLNSTNVDRQSDAVHAHHFLRFNPSNPHVGGEDRQHQPPHQSPSTRSGISIIGYAGEAI